MTFVSYAQNFEDVLLWRALRTVTNGFYIDVGASHPDDDSVTRAFYDRGWRGINVEPTAAAFLRLTAARPRDVNLQLAISGAPGRMSFYVVDGANDGLSTLDDAVISKYREIGLRSVETSIEVDTLASVCRQYAPAEIHFLKIDVEGAERAVIEGADFRSFRPWIVLAEATAPMSTRETHHGWDAMVIEAGYRFVWFDGLNRFYVALEHCERLAPFFQTPPNVFDDFLCAADTRLARLVTRSETRADALQARALLAERNAVIARDAADVAQMRMLGLNTAALQAKASGEFWQAEAGRLRERAEQASRGEAQAIASLEMMRRSTSWRITGPIRRALRIAGRGRPRGAPLDVAPPAAPDYPSEPKLVRVPPSSKPHGMLGAVHQFHSGSAIGDAITNAMLLMRDLLRGLGYDSHIFAEHRAPGLESDIFPLDALPQDGHYVLIVRHSLGHGVLTQILGLPVPKILLYHNITPPALLAGIPSLQQAAIQGREQLRELRPAVVGALADSEFNALELRQCGYEQVATCPLLFDVDRWMSSAPAPARGPIFTMLFVGRLCPSKGQLELVAAYARFRSLYEGESRLVLVGRNDEDAYAVELVAQIRRLKIDTGAVAVTGLVSDAALRQWYAEADLYVSLSRHEGFGVPLVEAMAQDVPVLAWSCGAVPYTLGGAAMLLESDAPAQVAEQMLALANDRPARDSIVQRQRHRLDWFRLEHHIPTLVSALERAGARSPETPATTYALAANMHFTIAGHVNGSYSLAEVNRALALALERGRPGKVRLVAVEGDATADLSRVPVDQREQVVALASRGEPPTSPHVVLSQHYPVWVPTGNADLTLAWFFWEEGLVPDTTVATLNRSFDGVLASSRSVAKALIDSGVAKPVRVLGHAPSLERFLSLRQERRRRRPGDVVNFLHVSSGFSRKGIDVLLSAFAATFRAGDPVRLVIKTFPNPHNDVAEQLGRLRAADPGLPAIELIDADVDDAALLDLYRAADVMVLPTRGEGYNLPAAEALAAGLRLIVTGHGGHMDFLANAPVRLLDFRMAPADTHLSIPFSLWAEPDPADLAAALRDAVQASNDRPPGFGQDVPADDTPIADRLANMATAILEAYAPHDGGIAMMTTWGVRCGIAGYARQLVAEMSGKITVLADRRTEPGGDPHVIPSWTMGDGADLDALACAIVRINPAALVIQHQPALVSWGNLPTLLKLPALHGRVLCIALHNAFHLLEIAEPERAAAVAALATASRVVVHTVQHVNLLARLGLQSNVALIPQGVPMPAVVARAAAPGVITSADPVLIGCHGFFLPDKGIRQLIEALPHIRQRFPRARLRLVNAAYPDGTSPVEIARCQELAAALGLEKSVEFISDFLPEAHSTELLAECELIVLPYQRSSEASSAALRSAMAAQVPIAVTPLSLFDEAEDAVFRLSGTTPEAMAGGIIELLTDGEARRLIVARALSWRQQRAWPVVGRRWDALLRGLIGSEVVVGAHPVR